MVLGRTTTLGPTSKCSAIARHQAGGREEEISLVAGQIGIDPPAGHHRVEVVRMDGGAPEEGVEHRASGLGVRTAADGYWPVAYSSGTG
jgi:hypothetical protein